MRLTQYITELSVAKKPKIKYIIRPDLFHADIKLDIDYYMAPAPSEYEYNFDANLDSLDQISKAEFPILQNAYSAYMDSLEGLAGQSARHLISAPAIWNIIFEDSAARTHQVDKGKQVALNLFAALEMVFKEFIKKMDPLVFQFTADTAEASRIKLYDLIARRITKNGYDVKMGNRGYKAYLFTVKGIDDDWWKEQHYIGK